MQRKIRCFYDSACRLAAGRYEASLCFISISTRGAALHLALRILSMGRVAEVGRLLADIGRRDHLFFALYGLQAVAEIIDGAIRSLVYYGANFFLAGLMGTCKLWVMLLWMAPWLWAGSHAYVVASGSNYTTPGSITPLHVAEGTLGKAFFVPIGGYILAVPPGSAEVWQVVSAPECICPPSAINVLDPVSGVTLATIPLATTAVALIFDAGGRFAYVSLSNGDLLKIAVASRKVVRTASIGGGASYGGPMVFSGDGSKLFIQESPAVLAVDPVSLTLVGEIPLSYTHSGIVVTGNTLLLVYDLELLYFDSSTLKQTNSVPVPFGSQIFAVSPDGSKIYLDAISNTAYTIDVLDFASGQILLTQAIPADLLNLLLSPDGSQIIIASSPVLFLDANTLAITKMVLPVGIPSSAAYIDANTILLLFGTTGAMMVVDHDSAQVTAAFPLGMIPMSGEVASPGDGRIYVGGSYAPSVVSTKFNRIVRNLNVGGNFTPCALARDQLYGGPPGSAFEVYNLATGGYSILPPPIQLQPGEYATAAFGSSPPDGRTYWSPFTVSSGESGIAIYSTATKTVLGTITLPITYRAPVFSRDSSTAYIPGQGAIAVYNAKTFQSIATFSYTMTFTSLAVSPDGSVIYATDQKAVYVLDAATGAQKRQIALPALVGAMALSSDGTTLFLTDSGRSSVDVINTASGQVMAVAVPYPPSSVAVVP